ncbi:MAG: MFS transporter [Oscillospiraceae bacterium]
MSKTAARSYVPVMVTYLLGIFMGAIDTGIVTPARTVIQNNMGVDEKTGIWMITIYTLAYAASIPITGKLADKKGRKVVYLTSIFLFGFGSLLCGLSEQTGSFAFLLAARVIQAVGGGGIMPVATAEFGTTFPKEKRGLALGLVGGVYGVANIVGASAGSFILDLFGTDRWQFIFYVNVPITAVILVMGFLNLPNSRNDDTRKIDIAGIFVLTVMVLSLMYGLKNIDFFDFANTIAARNVLPFLLVFAVLVPVFIFAEKHAQDPVVNIGYFKNPRILVTLFLGFLTGIVLMGMIFVPQFSENAMRIATGKGGYFVLILGLFSGAAAPFSGKLIDMLGVKLVLGTGFLVSAAGALFLILVVEPHPSFLSIFAGLALIGAGIGFTIGTPLNYMMLDNTRAEESNSALAALSLIRSIGTAIAPAIMVGFLSHAGMNLQQNITALLPTEVAVQPFANAQELDQTLTTLKADPMMGERLADVNIPDFSAQNTITIDFSASGGNAFPQELIDLLKTSDVTTITDNCKTISRAMFAQTTPPVIAGIQNGIASGITAVDDARAQLDGAIASVSADAALKAMRDAQAQLADVSAKMTVMNNDIPGAFNTAQENYLAAIEARRTPLEDEFISTLNTGFTQLYLTVTIASTAGLAVLMLYRRKRPEEA